MKKIPTLIATLIITFFTQVVHAQCPTDNIVFTTQGEIDDFGIYYPECTNFTHEIEIQPAGVIDNITNLNGLSHLKTISKLTLHDCNQLQDFTGLSSLTDIGLLSLYGNELLQDFTGLNHVKHIQYLSLGIGSSLGPNETSFIKVFNGLDSISTIKSIRLGYSNLESFNGLEHITELKDLDIYIAPYLSSFQGLEAVSKITNYFSIYDAPITDFTGIPNLSYVKEFNIKSLAITSLDGLQNLKEVESLSLAAPKITTFAPLESLTTISKYLSLRSLESMTHFSKIGQVSEIGTDLIIANNGALMDLTGLGIKTVGRNFRIGGIDQRMFYNSHFNCAEYDFTPTPNSKITSLKGLEEFEHIGGQLTVSANDNLVSLEGLSNNLEVGAIQIGEYGSLGLYPFNIAVGNWKLTDLFGFNLKKVDYIQIIGNHNLQSLSGLMVDSVSYLITISDNSSLTSLNGIDSLNYIESLQIGTNVYPFSHHGNSALSDISALKNITIKSGLTIVNNPLLSTCANKAICTFLDNPNGYVNIKDNAPGCNSEYEIECNSITGTVFYDSNQNKIMDNNEYGINNMKINFAPSNSEATTNINGQFHHIAEIDSLYELSIVPVTDWVLTTDSASYTVVYDPYDFYDYKFGLYPTFSKHDASINIASDATRCNTNVDFFLRFQNTGTFLEAGVVQLQFDSNSTFISTSFDTGLTIDTINHILQWHYDSLAPFQYQDIEITFGMPNQNSTNDTLQFLAEMYGDSAGAGVLLDSYAYTPIVLCSFDPNDKQVMPSGERAEHYTLHDQKLTYTIRFQNTGNAEAIDITILDTIDTDLDISTLRIVNSSFPVQTSIKGQAIEFLFKNILLPDSSHYEPSSHGFVTYEIKPKAGLSDYTEIKNKAYIIFDANDAIMTNTVTNTMVTMIPVALQEIDQVDIAIRPNPADNVIYITAKNQKLIDKVLIYNTLGELVLAQKETRVDIGHLPKGIYLVKVKTGRKIGVGKLVVD